MVPYLFYHYFRHAHSVYRSISILWLHSVICSDWACYTKVMSHPWHSSLCFVCSHVLVGQESMARTLHIHSIHKTAWVRRECTGATLWILSSIFLIWTLNCDQTHVDLLGAISWRETLPFDSWRERFIDQLLHWGLITSLLYIFRFDGCEEASGLVTSLVLVWTLHYVPQSELWSLSTTTCLA